MTDHNIETTPTHCSARAAMPMFQRMTESTSATSTAERLRRLWRLGAGLRR